VSVFTKTNPVGVDRQIQDFQEVLYDLLKKKWGIIGDSAWGCYGRVYKNQTTDGYSPEAYVGNGEYQEVYFDDNLMALSFFYVGDSTKHNRLSATAPVSLVFMVNVSKLKPKAVHRADEEIRLDVQSFCQTPRCGFMLTEFVTGIDSVFKDFSGMRKAGTKYMDQHPLHCFRLDFSVSYNIHNS
jgi:hypothetical protein